MSNYTPKVHEQITYVWRTTTGSGEVVKVNPKTVVVKTKIGMMRVDRSLILHPGEDAADRIKANHEQAKARHTPTVEKGQHVTVANVKGAGSWAGISGVVVKVNQVKAKISTSRGVVNVPFSMLVPA